MEKYEFRKYKRKIQLTPDEIQAFCIPSDSEDELECDDSDNDPTVQIDNIPIDSSDNEDDIVKPRLITSHNSDISSDCTNSTSVTKVDITQPSTSFQSNDNVSQGKPRKQTQKKNNIIWRLRKNTFNDDAFIFKGNNTLPLDVMKLDTPYQFFKYFITDELLSTITEETNFYSSQINPSKPTNFINYDIQKFLGICIFNSVLSTSNNRDMWNDVIGNDIVKETMSQKSFEKLRSTLHFNDNSKQPKAEDPNYDKLYKLRPVLDYLNKKFLSIPMNEYLSIDEQICATKIRHHMKQYMKDKPHKWGYKFFVLCGEMGYAYKIELYSGQENDPKYRLNDEPDIGASGNVVIRLAREIPKHQNYKLCFDRYYTSVYLAVYLSKIGTPCVGTIQINRLPNCKFPKNEELKKEPRGFSQEYCAIIDSVEVSTVIYKDNSNVALLSTFIGEDPKTEVKRYDRKRKQHIQVPCPAIVSIYNKHMGNVDLLDSNIGRLRIKIKSRKWYLRLLYHFVDLTVINAWVLYRRVHLQEKEKMLTQKKFRIELAQSLCKIGPKAQKRGRPRSTDVVEQKRINYRGSSLPTADVRRDPQDHWPEWKQKRTTCKFPGCRGYTFVACEKCKVNLCCNKDKNCFKQFHIL